MRDEIGAYERAREYGHYSMGGLRGIKRDIWEGGHRVPFVARWPGVIPAGTSCDHLASLADLMPTCADILGVPLPAGAAPDGVSLLPLLRNPASGPVRAYAVHHSCSGRFAIREGNWVYLEAPGGDDNGWAGGEPAWLKADRGYPPVEAGAQLYDLSDDLSERRNRLSDFPAVVRRLQDLLAAVRSEPPLSPRA
jgi:arylsulfatase A-like enzyme